MKSKRNLEHYNFFNSVEDGIRNIKIGDNIKTVFEPVAQLGYSISEPIKTSIKNSRNKKAISSSQVSGGIGNENTTFGSGSVNVKSPINYPVINVPKSDYSANQIKEFVNNSGQVDSGNIIKNSFDFSKLLKPLLFSLAAFFVIRLILK